MAARFETGRRGVLGGAVALAAPGLAVARSGEAAGEAPAARGRLKRSVSRWCFGKMTLDELCGHAARIGYKGIDLLEPKDWPVVRKHGLVCPLGSLGGPITIEKGLNRVENHGPILHALAKGIDLAAEAQVPNLVCFSGNRAGMSDAEGLELRPGPAPEARSAVELSLNLHFRRHYTALIKAVVVDALPHQKLAGLAGQVISAPNKRKFHLLGTDVTSNPRPFASTRPDRGFVYQPNTIKGNKPIVIGHQYSFWAWLPEYDPSQKSHWVVPLSMQRVSSQANKEMAGAQQLGDLLADKDLPFGETFCVEVADSAYSKPAYLNANREHTNLVTIARARGTRTFYRQPAPNDKPAEKGHTQGFISQNSLDTTQSAFEAAAAAVKSAGAQAQLARKR